MSEYTLEISTADDLPDVISELAWITRKLLGPYSETAAKLSKLYHEACAELKEIEGTRGR